MRNEEILSMVKKSMLQLEEDLSLFEQGESLRGYPMAYHMLGFAKGLRFADRDKVVVLLDSICEFTTSPYAYIEEEGFAGVLTDTEHCRVVRSFKGSLMQLYLIAQSLIKEIGDTDSTGLTIENIFTNVFI